MNWSLFNLYEFARKTFAPAEERERVDSYSSLYGVLIAVSLTIMAAVTGIIFAFFILWNGLQLYLPGFLVLFAAGNYLMITRSVHGARLFRYVAGGYIIYFFAVLAWLAA
jgi:4-hydroxybenzoate polyprenyltransferase